MPSSNRTTHRSALRPTRVGVASAFAAGVLLASLCFGQMNGGAGSGLLTDRRPGLPNTTPEPLKGVELKDRLGSTIPLTLEFTRSDGVKVKLADLFNKPIGGVQASSGPKRPVVMVLMYFSCPMLCPMVMDSLTRQMREIDFSAGKEFDVVVVSFDERDTTKAASEMKAAALLSYGRAPLNPASDADRSASSSVENGITFLTGPAATSRELGDALGFHYTYQEKTGQFAHGAVTFVLTPEGKISRYITNALGASSADLRLALVDASKGAIGSWTDQLMLRCLHFNPDAGGYTMSIMRGMQVAGVLGVGALGGTIAMYLRNERRRRLAAGSPRISRRSSTPSPSLDHVMLTGHSG